MQHQRQRNAGFRFGSALEQLLEQQQLYLQAVQAAAGPPFVGTIYNCKKLRHQFNAAVPNAYRDYQRQFEAASW